RRLGDRDGALVARATELDHAFAQREDRVVPTDTRTGAWAETCPTLTDDDHAGLDLLSREDLHAKPLGLRIATVLRRAEALLVRHLLLLPRLGERRFERGDRTLALAVRLLVLEGGLKRRGIPRGCGVLHRGHGHLRVAVRKAGSLCCRSPRLLRFGFRLLRLLRSRRRATLASSDGLDLDLRERCAEPGVTLVAGALLVLADADLRAALLAEHLRRDNDA